MLVRVENDVFVAGIEYDGQKAIRWAPILGQFRFHTRHKFLKALSSYPFRKNNWRYTLMSKTVEGIVQFIGQRGKAYNIKVSDAWYGYGFTKPEFAQNDRVKFNVVEKNGFENVDPTSVEVLEKGAIAQPASGGSKSVDWDLKDRRIEFQSARRDAILLLHLWLV